MVFKDMGLVSQVFDETTLNSLRGHLAIGHAATPPPGASVWKNAQPTFRPTATGGIALGHNGNLTNTVELEQWLAERDRRRTRWSPGAPPLEPPGTHDATNDTSLVTALMATYPGLTTEQAAAEVLPRLKGAFSLVFMDEETLYAARDPQGIRPLVLGRLERGWVVASETAALDIVGASFIREVAPGELIAVDAAGLRSTPLRRARPQGLPVRVRLPGPPRHHDLGPAAALGPGRGRPHPGEGVPGRGRPGHPGAGVGHAGRDRVRRAVGDPVRPGPGQELLRRADLHPAQPDASASSASG